MSAVYQTYIQKAVFSSCIIVQWIDVNNVMQIKIGDFN